MTTDSDTNAAEKPMSIRECLDAVHKAGGNAWDKVADPDGFIRWMRGSDDPNDVAAAEQAMQSMPAQSPASAPEQASVGAEEEWYEWIEPSGAADDSPVYLRVPRSTAIKMSKAALAQEYPDKSYPDDQQALDDFIAVHWATALSPRPDVREQQAEQIAKLQRFKDWVHAYLDAQGVPHHPPGTHGAEGCRIGDRMDWLMDRLRKAEAQQAEQVDGGLSEALQLLEQNGRKDLAKMVRDALAALAAAAKGQGTVRT